MAWFNDYLDIVFALLCLINGCLGIRAMLVFVMIVSINQTYESLNASKVILMTIQYIPRNMHTVFALLCFVVVIHWLIFPYPSGLLHWHHGNLTIAPVPAKQPWWIWINTSSEFIMNDCITTTKQSTTKPCAYFLGYTVCRYLTSKGEPCAQFLWWTTFAAVVDFLTFDIKVEHRDYIMKIR